MEDSRDAAASARPVHAPRSSRCWSLAVAARGRARGAAASTTTGRAARSRAAGRRLLRARRRALEHRRIRCTTRRSRRSPTAPNGLIERGMAATRATDATTGAVLDTKGGSSLVLRFAADGSLDVDGHGWILRRGTCRATTATSVPGLFLIHGPGHRDVRHRTGTFVNGDLQRDRDRRVRGARRLTARTSNRNGPPGVRRAVVSAVVTGASCSRRATRSARATRRGRCRPSGTACRSRGRGRDRTRSRDRGRAARRS